MFVYSTTWLYLLCTFNCFCFSLLYPYNTHKLDYHSTPYVFLGYSSSNLSYCCLNLSSHCIYISSHVCFHENHFLFIEFDRFLHISSSMSIPTLPKNLSSFTTFSMPKTLALRSSPTSPSVSLSPPTLLSLDYSPSSGFVVPALFPSDSPIFVAFLTSLSSASSPSSAFAQSTPCIDLVVDLSSYSLP